MLIEVACLGRSVGKCFGLHGDSARGHCRHQDQAPTINREKAPQSDCFGCPAPPAPLQMG